MFSDSIAPDKKPRDFNSCACVCIFFPLRKVVLVFFIARGIWNCWTQEICLGNLTPVSYKVGANKEVENENLKENENCKDGFSPP